MTKIDFYFRQFTKGIVCFLILCADFITRIEIVCLVAIKRRHENEFFEWEKVREASQNS